MAGSRCCVFFLMMGLFVSVSGQQCQSAVQAVTTITNSQTAANVVYQSLNGSSRGVCGFSPTCCSSQAEQLLRQNTITQYQTALRSNMRTAFQPCMTNTTHVQSADYIMLWRDQIVDALTASNPQFNTPEIFDPFTNYVRNGILDLNLPSLKEQIVDMFFLAYHASFKASVEQLGSSVPDTTAFRDCLKTNFFLNNAQDGINQRYRTLEPRMNLLLRFLLALKTSDSVLESIMNHMLSPECGDALLRLTHCKECSGTTSSSPSCTPFCQNVLRGCLVDLTEVGHVLQEFATQINAMKDKIVNRDDPFEAIDGLTNEMFSIASNGRTAAFGSTSMIETTCGVTFPSSGRRRRDVKDSHVSRRQATPSPALTSAAQCAQNVATFVQNLPDQLCTSLTSVTGNTNCWNGDSIGSYSKTLVSPDRLSQVNNSELLKVYPDTGLQYRDAIAQLKNMTAQLTSCSGALDCDVKLVSLSVPTPSDFTLTGPRYENISRPISVPVSTTPVIPPVMSSTITTSYHSSSSSFFESSTPVFEPSPTSTGLIVEPSSSPVTTIHLTTQSSLPRTTTTNFVIDVSPLPTSSNLVVESSFPATTTNLVVESSSLYATSTVIPSLPRTTAYESSSFPATSTSLKAESSSTSLRPSLVANRPSSSVRIQISFRALTSPVTTSTPPVASSRPSITPIDSGPASSVLIGAFGVGWLVLVLVITLILIITVVIVIVRKRSRSTGEKCAASAHVDKNGSTSVELSKNQEASQNIYIDQEPHITKDPPENSAVLSTSPRVLYSPRFSGTNPVAINTVV